MDSHLKTIKFDWNLTGLYSTVLNNIYFTDIFTYSNISDSQDNYAGGKRITLISLSKKTHKCISYAHQLPSLIPYNEDLLNR